MFRTPTLSAVAFAACTGMAAADQAKIDSATSAGPDSLSTDAAVMDWDGTVLREGTNGWTCLPDRPDNGGTDPFCVDEAWMNLIDAMINGTEPSYENIGIAYMLMGDAPVSNVSPGQSKEEAGDQWVEGLGAHLMLLVPDPALYDTVSTDPNNGGPWVMWPETPFAHIMVPIESYPE